MTGPVICICSPLRMSRLLPAVVDRLQWSLNYIKESHIFRRFSRTPSTNGSGNDYRVFKLPHGKFPLKYFGMTWLWVWVVLNIQFNWSIPLPVLPSDQSGVGVISHLSSGTINDAPWAAGDRTRQHRQSINLCLQDALTASPRQTSCLICSRAYSVSGKLNTHTDTHHTDINTSPTRHEVIRSQQGLLVLSGAPLVTLGTPPTSSETKQMTRKLVRR